MLTKIFAGAALIVALLTITAGYTQRSAMVLRSEKQDNYWPRHGTTSSGYYRGGTWYLSPNRSSYGGFRGGGPSAGK